MANVNCNLSEPQIAAIELLLNWFDNHIGNLTEQKINSNVWRALQAHNILTYDHDSGLVEITPFGIQSYCATVLTKYDGPTHERIHSALNNYQRLYCGEKHTVAS